MDGIYILQTSGKEGPEYRVSEFEDIKVLTLNNDGKYVKDIKVLLNNIRRFFSSSKVFLDGEEAVNHAILMLEVFKEKGIEFKNGVKIMPPMEIVF